jgi:hypothetical protein
MELFDSIQLWLWFLLWKPPNPARGDLLTRTKIHPLYVISFGCSVFCTERDKPHTLMNQGWEEVRGVASVETIH